MDTWNTPAEPLARKGLPTWAKVLLGCGILAALAMGACVVGGAYVLRKSRTVITEMTRQPMQELAGLVRDAATPEALQRFYQDHPALSKRYPDAASFAAAMKELGTRVGPLPSEIQDFMTLMKEQRLELKAHKDNGVKGLTLKYRNPGKETLVGEWEAGKLVDLRVE